MLSSPRALITATPSHLSLTLSSAALSTHRLLSTMKTAEVPYAADAEVSLSFDELQVCLFHPPPLRARIN